MSESIDVQLASGEPAVPRAAVIARWADLALTRQGVDAALTVRVVDESEGRSLNQQYRGRDGATNVLSFGFESPPGVDIDLLGDVVICAPVVVREAQAQRKTADAHFAHMVVHGVLHLLGYDHQTSEEARGMEDIETQILSALGFADPYQLAGESQQPRTQPS